MILPCRGPIILLCILLCLSFIGAGVAHGKDPEPSPGPRVRVVSLPYVSFAPLHIAQEEGYFAEQSLRVEFVTMTVAADAIPSLIRGDLDVMAETIFPGFLNAIARGSRIRIVADKGYHSPAGCPYSAIMARRTLVEEGKLNHLSQLKGRRVSLIQDSGVSGYYLEKALQQAGLTLNDVEKVFMPMPARLEAFERDAIDISTATEPWVTRMAQTGHALIWKPIQQLLPNFQHAMLLYGPTLLDKNQEAGRRFMLAYLKAVRQYNHGKTDRNVKIVAKYTKTDEDLLRRSCWPSLREDGQINAESLLDYQRWALRKGFLDRIVPANQFWDPTFVEAANKGVNKPSR